MKIVSIVKLGAFAVIENALAHDSSPEVHLTSNFNSSWSGTLSVTTNLNTFLISATSLTAIDATVALLLVNVT